MKSGRCMGTSGRGTYDGQGCGRVGIDWEEATTGPRAADEMYHEVTQCLVGSNSWIKCANQARRRLAAFYESNEIAAAAEFWLRRHTRPEPVEVAGPVSSRSRRADRPATYSDGGATIRRVNGPQLVDGVARAERSREHIAFLLLVSGVTLLGTEFGGASFWFGSRVAGIPAQYLWLALILVGIGADGHQKTGGAHDSATASKPPSFVAATGRTRSNCRSAHWCLDECSRAIR